MELLIQQRTAQQDYRPRCTASWQKFRTTLIHDGTVLEKSIEI